MLLNRISRVLIVLCIGIPFLVQAHGSNPALKLKIMSDDKLTFEFVHHNSDMPNTKKVIKSGRTFYTKLDQNRLRALCTRRAICRRTMATDWYNRAVDSEYRCLDIATLLQQRGNKKLLEVAYKKEFCSPESIWRY